MLLAGLTLVFLIAVVTLVGLGAYSGVALSPLVLGALFVTLIPTTIGGLLSAVGIAGMDRLLKVNVLATSGRAVEAAGDVDTLLLDKTGTITFGARMATEVIPAPGVRPERALAAARGRADVVLLGSGRGGMHMLRLSDRAAAAAALVRRRGTALLLSLFLAVRHLGGNRWRCCLRVRTGPR